MSFTQRLRRLAAPVVRELRSRRTSPTWDGVYASFGDAPVSGPAFGGTVWLDKIQRVTEEIRDHSGSAAIASGEYALLPLVLSLEATPTTVLDFGGGLGRDYLTAKAASFGAALDYHIVEVATLCERGRALHSASSNLHFHETFPELERVDLINCHSSLQFVDDWKMVLGRLCDYGARKILFIHVPAGNISTFATLQRNVEGSVIPCWFFSVEELVAEMAGAGYQLTYRSVLERTYDMSNFPVARRVHQPCNLLFSRAAS